MRIRVALLLVAFSISTAAPAFAQTGGRFAVGIDYGVKTPLDSSGATGGQSIGVDWRFGHGSEGWGFKYGLGWYSTNIGWSVDGQDVDLGRLRVRPIMVGIGYGIKRGRTTITPRLIGGYAFNKVAQSAQLEDEYNNRFGAQAASIDVSNAFVLRPGISAWYDVNEKIGIQLSANYVVARPEVTVTSSRGRDVRRLPVDMFTVKIGAVYSIF